MFELPPPEDDGLHISDVGDWSGDKHFYLRKYIDAFTTSMHGNRNWSGLHYIDLFAGAGIERQKVSGKLEWGSALIAAQAPKQFAGLHLCEKDAKKQKTLATRIARTHKGTTNQVLLGNANQKVHQIMKAIPPRSLSLAFLDPYGLHLEFETLKLLAAKRVDMIIFFPDFLDAVRNYKIYRDKTDSNLDRALGTTAWREQMEHLPQSRRAQEFREIYQSRIETLGYSYFGSKRISARGHPLYILMLCSRHPLAEKLWKEVTKKEPDGQQMLDF